MSLPSATELLLAWDAKRPRSQQKEIGVSQLGCCRRQTGYMLASFPADEDFEPNVTQAAMGSAIHEALAAGARLAIPGAHAEALEIHFAGLTGHPDLVHDGTVVDFKTLGYSMQLAGIRQKGPPQRNIWQVSVYAAGLILAGHPVTTTRLNYIARDSGDEFVWEQPFDAAVVEEAMIWLADVRAGPIEILPRDYRPDSAMCKSCQFFTRCWDAPRGTDDRHVLFTDDPDVASWALALWDAGLTRKRAEELEKDAKGALDYLRTITRPGERQEFAVAGLDEGDVLIFKVSKGRTSLDKDKIFEDYQRAGALPPTQTGAPVISVALVSREERDD